MLLFPHAALLHIVGILPQTRTSFLVEEKKQELLYTYSITAAGVILLNSVYAYCTHTGAKEIFAGWTAAAFYGAGDIAPNYLWPVPYRIGAIWFLLALFWSQLFVHYIAAKRYAPLAVLASFCMGYFSSSIFWFPLSIQAAMTASLYVYLGYLLRKYNVFTLLNKHTLLYSIPAAAWIVFLLFYPGLNIALNQYGKGWYVLLALIGSLAASTCIVGISALLDRYLNFIATPLAFCGQYTLALLCVHLLEDDTIPWNIVMPIVTSLTDGHATGFVLFLIRFTFDCVLACGLYHIPKVNVLFYPSLQGKRL